MPRFSTSVSTTPKAVAYIDYTGDLFIKRTDNPANGSKAIRIKAVEVAGMTIVSEVKCFEPNRPDNLSVIYKGDQVLIQF